MVKLEKLTDKEILKIARLPGEWNFEVPYSRLELRKNSKLQEEDISLRLKKGFFGNVYATIIYGSYSIGYKKPSYRLKRLYNQIEKDIDKKEKNFQNKVKERRKLKVQQGVKKIRKYL